MRQPMRNTAKLPRKLLNELGLEDSISSGARFISRRPKLRKERGKAARVLKRSQQSHGQALTHPRAVLQRTEQVNDQRSSVNFERSEEEKATARAKAPKSILKPSKAIASKTARKEAHAGLSPSPPPRLSQAVEDRLAADDAEIEALEKALGVKGNKKLPKSFEDDGLGSLLDGLDDLASADRLDSSKRKRAEGEEWLEKKRRKANGVGKSTGASDSSRQGLSDGRLSSEDDQTDGNVEDQSKSQASISAEWSDLECGSFDGCDDSIDSVPPKASQHRVRENPYVAPATNVPQPAKYVPPSLRTPSTSDQESLQRIRRQIQGLLNRLSEANLVSILGDLEKLYRDNSRQHVSSTLLNLLIGLLCDPTVLQDTFIILHAGFIAAVFKIIGTDFGAQAVQRVVEEFDSIYNHKENEYSGGKKLTNLISLMSELYNFQVIGCGLVYDFIHTFLGDLSEMNAELLLKIIRNSGPQLRQDDPSSLKDIVLLIQPAVAKAGEESLSVRTKFMIETINDLKNNHMKTGIAASTITSEHTIRMKKTLGSLNSRSVKATEPLRIGLRDIRDTGIRGKWWLVGASHRKEGQDDFGKSAHSENSIDQKEMIANDDGHASLAQLAKEQRMNTDIRRSIFITIMSATDYRDAHLRLLKLRLKKNQELEIPKVLVHCARAETIYNPFYSLISRQLCSDRKLKIAFQFCLWDFFKLMGEGGDEEKEEEEDDDERTEVLETRSIVNVAKMYGTLVAEGGLSLSILKNLNFAYLEPRTRTFVEIFFITVILHSQRGSEAVKKEQPLIEIFLRVKNIPSLARGSQYFLKKVVNKTDVVSNKQDRGTIKWGCKVVGDALAVIAFANVEH